MTKVRREVARAYVHSASRFAASFITGDSVKRSSTLHYANPSQPEFTLCGDAFDLNKLDDPDAETPWFAKQGEFISCPRCIRAIDDIRNGLTKKYRMR